MRARDPNAEPPSERSSEIGLEPMDERQLARLRVGATIQRKWRLDGLLGTGGMAAVYAATHRNGSRAALKIMHRELASDPVIRDRFLREGYVANKVEHVGRVAILDDDVTEHDEPFLVMELLDGETVQQLWKRKNRKLDINEAMWIASEVLDALEAFHEKGIVHRDLKPANVFITNQGQVKILDYGVARMEHGGGDRTRAGTALGTPSFMAPEQAMGLVDSIDGRSDVFSVGATLYALLSGQRLHQGRSDNEAFILAATTPAPSLARVANTLPVDVIALVDKALAWDPRNRFESAAAMRKASLVLLDKYGGPPENAAQPSTQRPGRPSRVTAEPQALVAHATALKDEDEKAGPNDPAVQRLIEVFRRLDRLLPAMHHYGKHHPEAETKLHATHQSLVEALRADPDAVYVSLTPYAMEHRTQPVWEPVGLFDAVPYNLFAAGVRKVAFEQGTTEEELRAFCEILLLDPNRDLLPEDDMAAALWERQLGHIKCDVITIFAEGDALERETFYAEQDELEEEARRMAEERANRAEAMAMAIDTDESAVRAAKQAATALALDPAARAALGTQLMITTERWTERYVDVLTEAILRARAEATLALCAEPLAESTRDLALGRKAETALSMWDALVHAVAMRAPEDGSLPGELTRAMFTPEALKLLLREVSKRSGDTAGPVTLGTSQAPASGAPASLGTTAGPGSFAPQSGGRPPSAAEALRIGELLLGVMEHLDGACVEVAAAAIPDIAHEAMRRGLYQYVERALAGHEDRIADILTSFDPETARPILKALAGSRREEAAAALARLTQARNPALRCEAVALAAKSPDEMRDELVKLAEAPEHDLRSAALRTLGLYKVRAAGPLLVKRVSDPAFQGMSPPEQREIIEAIFTLHPPRGEALAIELVQKHGIMPDEPLDVTRTICAELLGREAKTEEALAAVSEAAKRRWWNGPALREAAQRAASAIAPRVGKRVPPATGEVA
ncbi:MAG: serine/threonine-protein kinase [Polyangiaceae bacterium]